MKLKKTTVEKNCRFFVPIVVYDLNCSFKNIKKEMFT